MFECNEYENSNVTNKNSLISIILHIKISNKQNIVKLTFSKPFRRK